MIRLTFHGAARTVTGSKALLQTSLKKALVDCGLFQGLKELRQKNWVPLEFQPSAVDLVILTHAHIDHSGYLPRLVRDGFRGRIFATPATADLVDLLLRDSAQIQEEDAEYANRKGYSKHRPALPLYTVQDAEKAIEQVHVVDYHEWQDLGDGLRFRFRHAGHIVGSGFVDLEGPSGGEVLRFLFSGDVGRYDAPLVPDPSVPGEPDVLIVESTYGDRRHPERPVEEELASVVQRAVERHGTLLVPCFAVGRSQQMIYLLRKVMEAGAAPELPIHLDSPMAVNATRIYRRYPEEHGLEDIEMQDGNCILYDRNVYLHKSREESIRLNELKGPRIILSSSGMMSGGRVLHHLRRLLPETHNTVLLAGFQAAGTRGRRLKNGEKTLRIHGRDVPVRAHLEEISGLSAHADSDQLMRWLEPLSKPPRRTFVVHGEEGASEAFAERLRSERGFECEVPSLGQSFTF